MTPSIEKQQPTEPVIPFIPFDELQRMGKAIAASGLFGVRTDAQAIALMLVAQAEGRHPALAARDYDIIQGRPAKKTEAMLRDFLAAGGTVEWQELSDTRAAAVFSHPAGGSVSVEWTFERAKRAGLAGKEMWAKYPRQMLRSRVVSEGVRTIYPAATSGMYVPEEVQEFAPVRREVEIRPVNSKAQEVKAALQATSAIPEPLPPPLDANGQPIPAFTGARPGSDDPITPAEIDAALEAGKGSVEREVPGGTVSTNLVHAGLVDRPTLEAARAKAAEAMLAKIHALMNQVRWEPEKQEQFLAEYRGREEKLLKHLQSQAARLIGKGGAPR